MTLLLAADTPGLVQRALLASTLVPLASFAGVIFSVSVVTHMLFWHPDDAR
jgi:hypothetical protein